MMLVGKALLADNADPSDDDVRWAISGNLCRCTGYMNIVESIRRRGGGGATVELRSDHDHHPEHRPRPPEIGGIGHSVRRHEDARLIEGQGRFLDDVTLPGMLHMAILRAPMAHARINGHRHVGGRRPLDGVVAVVTGELMAQHGLAWMPTLSGDTQAVLATDKVRYQGQEVAAVVATDRYIAEDALELIDVDYEILPPVTTPQQALADGAPLIRDEKEGQTDNLVYEWETGDAAATEAAFAEADRVVTLETHYPRSHPAPLETCGVVADVNSRHRPGDDLDDIAGAARHPHPVRHGRRPARAEHPGHQPRHRRRLRQQGADLPRLRRGHRGVAAHRQAGEVGRDPQREPHLHRLRPRLPHEGRAGGHRRGQDPGAAGRHALGPGRVLRRRPADASSGPGSSTS